MPLLMTHSEIFAARFDATSTGLEAAIKAMKTAGATEAECARIIMAALKLQIRDADAVVHNSLAWSNETRELPEFREYIEQVLTRLRRKTQA